MSTFFMVGISVVIRSPPPPHTHWGKSAMNMFTVSGRRDQRWLPYLKYKEIGTKQEGSYSGTSLLRSTHWTETFCATVHAKHFLFPKYHSCSSYFKSTNCNFIMLFLHYSITAAATLWERGISSQKTLHYYVRFLNLSLNLDFRMDK